MKNTKLFSFAMIVVILLAACGGGGIPSMPSCNVGDIVCIQNVLSQVEVIPTVGIEVDLTGTALAATQLPGSGMPTSPTEPTYSPPTDSIGGGEFLTPTLPPATPEFTQGPILAENSTVIPNATSTQTGDGTLFAGLPEKVREEINKLQTELQTPVLVQKVGDAHAVVAGLDFSAYQGRQFEYMKKLVDLAEANGMRVELEVGVLDTFTPCPPNTICIKVDFRDKFKTFHVNSLNYYAGTFTGFFRADANEFEHHSEFAGKFYHIFLVAPEPRTNSVSGKDPAAIYDLVYNLYSLLKPGSEILVYLNPWYNIVREGNTTGITNAHMIAAIQDAAQDRGAPQPYYSLYAEMNKIVDTVKAELDSGWITRKMFPQTWLVMVTKK